MRNNLLFLILALLWLHPSCVANSLGDNDGMIPSIAPEYPITLDFHLDYTTQKRASSRELSSYPRLCDSFYTLELQLNGLQIYRSFFKADRVWNAQYHTFAVQPQYPISLSSMAKYPIPVHESSKQLSTEEDVTVNNDLEYEWWYDSRYLYLSGDRKMVDGKALYEGFVINTTPIKNDFKLISVHSYSNESILSVYLVSDNSVVYHEDICGEKRVAIPVPEDKRVDQIYLFGTETTLNKIILE